jgi:hypothetical protein
MVHPDEPTTPRQNKQEHTAPKEEPESDTVKQKKRRNTPAKPFHDPSQRKKPRKHPKQIRFHAETRSITNQKTLMICHHPKPGNQHRKHRSDDERPPLPP